MAGRFSKRPVDGDHQHRHVAYWRPRIDPDASSITSRDGVVVSAPSSLKNPLKSGYFLGGGRVTDKPISGGSDPLQKVVGAIRKRQKRKLGNKQSHTKRTAFTLVQAALQLIDGVHQIGRPRPTQDGRSSCDSRRIKSLHNSVNRC